MNHNHLSHLKQKPAKKSSITHYFQKLHTTPTQRTPQTTSIDLTQSEDELIDLTDSTPSRGIRVQGAFGSQGSHTEELTSNSKYKSATSFNVEQQKMPTFSSLDAQPTYIPPPKANRIVPVQRQTSQSSGMSITDRPNSGNTYTVQGTGMVSGKRQLPSGWYKSIQTSASPYTSSDTRKRTANVSNAAPDKRQRSANNVSYISSVNAMAAIQGKPTKEHVMKGMTSMSTSRKSYSSKGTYNKRKTTGRTASSSNNNAYRPPLSAEQQRVYNMVVQERKNIFFTGSAGTGKSVLLRAIIDKLRETYPDGVAVTAPTGIAACNISGSTIHSFAGIGLGQDPVDRLVDKVRTSKAGERWKKTRVLIIDEVSMLDADLFDKIETIARTIRISQAPFGGIQLVITGDFFQLPPVSRYQMAKFAFQANAWPKVVTRTIMLKQVFRQKDTEFVDILNEMRLGRLSEAAIAKFQTLSRAPERHDMIEPTELFALRDQVDRANTSRLNSLPGEMRVFRAYDYGDKNKVEGCLAPEVVQLKKDAQVMLLKNMDQNLVNGSIGIVRGFVGDPGFDTENAIRRRLPPNRFNNPNTELEVDVEAQKGNPIVAFGDREVMLEKETWSIELPGGDVVASRTQYPLMLAWAMSIHKSQGQTLESVRVDLGKVFEKGQAYVALSRATSLKSLQILNFHPSKVMAHDRVAEFYRSLSTV